MGYPLSAVPVASVDSSATLSAPYPPPERVLDAFAKALDTVGARRIERVQNRLTFKPGFFRLDWNPLALVESGSIVLEPWPDRLVIRCRMATPRLAIASVGGALFFAVIFFQSGPNLGGTFATIFGALVVTGYSLYPRRRIRSWFAGVLRDIDAGH
jgi:hypothetical protein